MPTLETRPPATVRSRGSSFRYTSAQRLPGPIVTFFLLQDSLTLFSFSSETVIPPSALDPPAKAAWPPLLTAKWHCVNRLSKTTAETSSVEDGLKMQRGDTSPWMPDQYEPVKISYAASFSVRTFSFPYRIERVEHFNHGKQDQQAALLCCEGGP